MQVAVRGQDCSSCLRLPINVNLDWSSPASSSLHLPDLNIWLSELPHPLHSSHFSTTCFCPILIYWSLLSSLLTQENLFPTVSPLTNSKLWFGRLFNMFGFARRTRHKSQRSDQAGGDVTGSSDRSVRHLLHSTTCIYRVTKSSTDSDLHSHRQIRAANGSDFSSLAQRTKSLIHYCLLTILMSSQYTD